MESIVFTTLTTEEFKTLLKESLREILSENPQLRSGDDELPWDIDQAAAFLKKKKNTLYEMTSEKTIPFYKKGNSLYFFRSQLEAWIREGKIKTKQELESEAATFSLKNELTKNQ